MRSSLPTRPSNNPPEENPYIIPDEPGIAAPDTLVCLHNSKWTVKDLSPQIKRKNIPTEREHGPIIGTSTPLKPMDTTDENGYEVPINFQRPIYMDFDAPPPPTMTQVAPQQAIKSQYQVQKSKTLPKSSINTRIQQFERKSSSLTSVDDNSRVKELRENKIHQANSQPCVCTASLKPNDSFLAKCLRERPVRQPAKIPTQQDRRLPCSPPFLSLSLPVDWKGNAEESYHYEEIIPAFPHRKSLADHDYVEIRDTQEKYLLQSIKDQADVGSPRSYSRGTSSSSSTHGSDVENMWERVAVPGVLRVKH